MIALFLATQIATTVHAYAAYSEPNAEAIEIEGREATTGWNDPKQSLAWYGEARTPTRLEIHIVTKPGPTRRLTLQVGRTRHRATTSGGRVSFGAFDVPKGPVRVALTTDATPGPEVESMESTGDVRWNNRKRGNAASVHLMWPTPKDADIRWFYNEAAMLTDPIWSYTMACGFARGYFGMQVNSPTRRCVIFSVWDAGSEAIDRNKVDADNRVQLVAKSEGVVADSFGNEGTGGHSHFDTMWKTGKPLRFLVGCRPEGDKTLYAGYWMAPGDKTWRLVAAFRAPKDGKPLRGLYSFSEDYVGLNGQRWRESAFGNGWIGLADGAWQPLTRATFSHDNQGKVDRWDYDGFVKEGRFHLRHGGFLSGSVKYGDLLTLLKTPPKPTFPLPELPR